jgi:serine protease AprX
MLARFASVAVMATAVLAAAGSHSTGSSSHASIDARVIADTRGGRTAHFIVVLGAQGDAEGAASGRGRIARGRAVTAILRDAASSQAPIVREARRLGVPYRSFWIVNAVSVIGDRQTVNALARLPGIASIQPDRAFHGSATDTATSVVGASAAAGWNLAKIGATSVWATGDTGQGIVYAAADSGVAWDHPALKSHYRGWDGTTAANDYNWWDAVHADIDGNGGNPCGFNTKAPCDDDTVHGHGTHTMGIAVGDDGAGNQIGVAPGAKWIACRNMDTGTGRPSTYIECLQFFLAPTDSNGQNPNPDRRPDIVGNSYACPPEEGCSIGALTAAVDAMRTAGIFMAVSAGNEGPSCSTVFWPPATDDSSVTVGSTDVSDVIARSSSRGPVTADGSARAKPDLVAPGVGIRSSVPGGGYGLLGGTSMASPHVGGAVALLWSAFPGLKGNVDATEQLLERSAFQLTTAEGCGGDTSAKVPNNVYGYGRLDVYAAYRAAEEANPPKLDVADAAGSEGSGRSMQLTLIVKLGRVSTRPVDVRYATVDGTAAAPADYQAASGELSFAPGETAKQVVVRVVPDTEVESDEMFKVRLSAPSNAMLGRSVATATIRNDDVDRKPPTISRLSVIPPNIRLSLSEKAVVSFTVKRGSRVVLRLARSLPLGRSTIRIPTRLKAGTYQVMTTPRDPSSNIGKSSLVAFRVGS